MATFTLMVLPGFASFGTFSSTRPSLATVAFGFSMMRYPVPAGNGCQPYFSGVIVRVAAGFGLLARSPARTVRGS